MTPAPSPARTPDRTVEATAGCAVCPHPVAAHDAISLRFCHATQATASTRGCACPLS